MYEIDALSTGPLAPPFAHLLAPLIHSHALHCSLRLRAPLGSFDRSLPHSFHSLWERTLCLRIECVTDDAVLVGVEGPKTPAPPLQPILLGTQWHS